MGKPIKRVQTARALRKDPEPAEMLLWQTLRNRALGGFKFRRQHPVAGRVADFACVEAKVIVELDGKAHALKQQEDAERTQLLEAEGWLVLRFGNYDIYNELDAVKERIWDVCHRRSQAKVKDEGQ